MDTPILVTGTAGFIGFSVACRLLDEGHRVVGYDSVNDYYPVAVKRARLDELARATVVALGEVAELSNIPGRAGRTDDVTGKAPRRRRVEV